MSQETDFNPARLITTLTSQGVNYVVIGSVAGRLFGSPAVTFDLDICYARDDTNLEVLAAALRSVHAKLRGADADVPFRLDAKTLRAGDSFTFETSLGDLDILGTPSGTAGYDDLVRTAERFEVEGVVVLAASIDDLIRMKRAAGRAKDRIHLEFLAALREELDDEEKTRRPRDD